MLYILGFDKRMTSCTHRYRIAQNSFTDLKIPYALPFPPSFCPPEPLATPDLYTVSVSFAFARTSYSWSHALYSLVGWLLSCSDWHFSFLRVFSWLDSSFHCRDVSQSA